jgi:hypothetical protein
MHPHPHRDRISGISFVPTALIQRQPRLESQITQSISIRAFGKVPAVQDPKTEN